MDWLKLNSKGILRGSLARADNVTQLIWIKMLAMANETRDRDGYLRYKKGEPYSLDFIATICNITRQQLDMAIDDFLDDIRDGKPRIDFTDDGSIKLNNWSYYQDKPPTIDAPPRLKKAISDEQRQKIARRYANMYPKVSIEVLNHDFGYQVIDKKTGEILEEIKE